MFVLIFLCFVTASAAEPQSCDDYCDLLLSAEIDPTWNSICNCHPQGQNDESDKKEQSTNNNPIYYEPIELHPIPYASFGYQPFVILNPTLNNGTTSRKLSHLESKLYTKHKRRNDVINEISNDTERYPLYLDLDIKKSRGGGRSSQNQVKDFDNLQLTEPELKDCLDLHLYLHLRQNGSSELKHIWDEENFKKYYHISDADLMIELNNRCHLPSNVVEQSLREIEDLLHAEKMFEFTKKNSSDSNPTYNMNVENIDISADEPLISSSSIIPEIFPNIEINGDGNSTSNVLLDQSHESTASLSLIESNQYESMDKSNEARSNNHTNTNITMESNFITSHDYTNHTKTFKEPEFNKNLVKLLPTTEESVKKNEDDIKYTVQNSNKLNKNKFKTNGPNDSGYDKDSWPISENFTEYLNSLPTTNNNISDFDNEYKQNHNISAPKEKEIKTNEERNNVSNMEDSDENNYEKLDMNDNMTYTNIQKTTINFVTSRLNVNNILSSDSAFKYDTDNTSNIKIYSNPTHEKSEDQNHSSNNYEYAIMKNNNDSSKLKMDPVLTNKSFKNVDGKIKVPLFKPNENELTTETITNNVTDIDCQSSDPRTEEYTSYTHRPIIPENEISSTIQIPKIIVTEYSNDTVGSTIEGIEQMDYNDYVTNSQLNIPNNIYGNEIAVHGSNDEHAEKNGLTGNIYFKFKKLLIPMNFVQNPDGRLNLTLDGTSFCKNLVNDGKPDGILSMLCNFAVNSNCTQINPFH